MTDERHEADPQPDPDPEGDHLPSVPAAGPPGNRRLEHAPGDRYRRRGIAALANDAAIPAEEGGPSPARGVLFGVIGAALAAVLLFVLGALFSFSAGLLIVALFAGRVVGLLVRGGAVDSLSSPARVSVAVIIVLAGVAIAQVATWGWAIAAQGARLGPVDYLADVFGPVLPLEYMVATLAAWWSAR